MPRYLSASLLIVMLLLGACAGQSASTPTGIGQPIIPPAASTAAPFPTATIAPSATPSPAPTMLPAPTPDLSRILDAYGVPMVLIPEGEFVMGTADNIGDERPAHTVALDAFYIDLTEATNSQYSACVAAGACDPPQRSDCCTEVPGGYVIWPDYFGNAEFDQYPVIFLRWTDAYAYCAWRGARLPSEAEWEKAARGVDQRQYPWGDDDPAPGLLNFYWLPGQFAGKPLGTTAPVGSYPAGASPYGVLDMAGNVYEWVQDWYAVDYYSRAPYENPIGPETGSYKVSRGGSFFNQAIRQRAAGRNNAWLPVDSFHFDGGVRCAQDAPLP